VAEKVLPAPRSETSLVAAAAEGKGDVATIYVRQIAHTPKLRTVAISRLPRIIV